MTGLAWDGENRPLGDKLCFSGQVLTFDFLMILYFFFHVKHLFKIKYLLAP